MISISTQTVLQALQLFSIATSKDQIENADKYLRECWKDPQFAIILLQIFQLSQLVPIKERAFVIFSRVVKNNWKNRGASKVDITQWKTPIKEKLLYYTTLAAPFPSFPRHLKDIICQIARNDFPVAWPQLHEYVVASIKNIVKNQSADALWALRISKKVLKQRSEKRSAYNKQQFQKFALPILEISFQLSNSFTQILQNTQKKITISQLAINRYLDSILISCLLTMSKQLQSDSNVGNMIIAILKKLDILYMLMSKNKEQQQLVEKNINTILQSVSNFQISYPFAFCNFLDHYFTLVFTLLSKAKDFKRQDTLKTVLTACIQVLKSPIYYFSAEQFEGSIFARKDIAFTHLQKVCYQHFHNFFNEQIIKNIFQQLVMETLSFRPYNVRDSIDEEETADRGQQLSVYLLACGLVKELMNRFKKSCLHLINSLIQQLPNLQEQYQCNIISILLVCPKVYQSGQIPVDKIISLLEYLLTKPSMYKQFALLASRYCLILISISGQKILQTLITIATSSQDLQTIYEAALTIKKFIQLESNLDLSNLDKVVLVILSLIYKYQDPTIRWYLVSLVGKIVSEVQFQHEFVDKCLSLQPLQKLCTQATPETLVYPTCDILTKLSHKSTNTKLYKLIISHIRSKITIELQSPESLYNLWRDSLRKYSSSHLDSEWVNLLQSYSSEIQEQFPSIFCEIVQEYLLLGLLKPSRTDIINIVIKGFNSENSASSIVKASYLELFSVYHQLYPPFQFSAQILGLVFKQLEEMQEWLEEIETNAFRSSLVSIVNQYIVQNVESFAANMQQLGIDWVNRWLINTRLLSLQFTFKLNALALIIMLKYLSEQQIQQNLNNIFHQIVFHLEPGPITNRVRREQLETHSRIILADLKPIFKKTLMEFITTRGISQELLLSKLNIITVNKLKEVIQQ